MATRVIQVDKNPDKDSGATHYSDKQKIKAVILYKMTGNVMAVASEMGIHHSTIRRWKREEWWQELSQEVREASRADLKGKLGSLMEKSIVQLQDRLDNGDWYYDQKKGQMLRRPLGAHVVNQVLKDSVDRQLLLDKLQNDEKMIETKEKLVDRLTLLNKQFIKFANAKEIKQDHAIHDEWETGLPEGEGLGSRSWEDQGAGRTECSPSPSGEEVGSQTSDEYAGGSQETDSETRNRQQSIESPGDFSPSERVVQEN